MPEDAKPEIPEPTVPEPGAGQQPAADAAMSGEVLHAEGTLASGGDPLINALVVAGYQPGTEEHARRIQGAAVAHFFQDAHLAKTESQRLRWQLGELQEKHRVVCEDKARLEGQLKAVEQPWHQNVRNIVGGGLTGSAFALWDVHAGIAIFFFVVGLLMIAVPFLALIRKRDV